MCWHVGLLGLTVLGLTVLGLILVGLIQLGLVPLGRNALQSLFSNQVAFAQSMFDQGYGTRIQPGCDAAAALEWLASSSWQRFADSCLGDGRARLAKGNRFREAGDS